MLDNLRLATKGPPLPANPGVCGLYFVKIEGLWATKLDMLIHRSQCQYNDSPVIPANKKRPFPANIVAMETILPYISFHGNIKRKDNEMDKSQLAPIIIGKLLHIGSMLQRNGDRMLLPFELNQQQFSIFFEIANAGKVKQKEMVNRLLLEKAHVSKVVKKLHNMGLITITPTAEDKRSAWLAPTAKGKQLLNECLSMFTGWNEEWTAKFDNQLLMTMLDNLTQLQDVFKAKLTPRSD